MLIVKMSRLGYNSLLKTLKLVLMPSQIHDSHQPWLINSILDSGHLTRQERKSLRILSSTSKCSCGASV